MKRGNNDEKIGDVLKQFVGQKSVNTGYTKVSIEKFWKEQMGKMINNYTDKITLYEGVLKVYISSSTLKQELTYNKKLIMNKIEKEFGEDYISELQIR